MAITKIDLASQVQGLLPAASLPNPSASTLGGVESYSAVANQFLTGISTSGVPVSAQPSFANISGTISAAQLPNPTATTLGGIESYASVSHQWINAISTSGVPSSTQPSFSDISGTATNAQIPAQLFMGGVNAQVGTTYTVVATDENKLVTFSNASPVAVTLAQATTAGFTSGAQFSFKNLGAGTVTITPTTSTIDGAASFQITTGGAICVYSDGTNYFVDRGVVTAPSTTALGGVFSYAAVSNQFLTQIGTTGAITSAQPSFANISGTVSAAQLPNPSATTLGGIQSLAAVASKWINQISTSGVPSATQPAFSDISGTVAAAQLPNPTTSSLGGVQAYNVVSNQFLTSISTSGVPASAQPSFANISGTVTNAQLPAQLFNAGVNAQTGTTYTVATTDENKLVTFSNAASIAVTLPAATTAGFTSGAFFHFVNLGAGTATITPTTSTINGGASIALGTGQGIDVYSDGTNYFAQKGLPPGASVINFVDNEIPSGTPNGVLTSFTLAHTPVNSSLSLYLNGALQKAGGNDYSISGTTITMTNPPISTAALLANYRY